MSHWAAHGTAAGVLFLPEILRPWSLAQWVQFYRYAHAGLPCLLLHTHDGCCVHLPAATWQMRAPAPSWPSCACCSSKAGWCSRCSGWTSEPCPCLAWLLGWGRLGVASCANGASLCAASAHPAHVHACCYCFTPAMVPAEKRCIACPSDPGAASVVRLRRGACCCSSWTRRGSSS